MKFAEPRGACVLEIEGQLKKLRTLAKVLGGARCEIGVRCWIGDAKC